MIFSNLTFINVYLFKAEIALIYQDCLFLEVITCPCAPGVILSLLETAGLGDGKLACVAVWGQWSWQSDSVAWPIPRHAMFAATALPLCARLAHSCTYASFRLSLYPCPLFPEELSLPMFSAKRSAVFASFRSWRKSTLGYFHFQHFLNSKKKENHFSVWS